MIKQMSGQVSCGSAGDYQADEQAGSSGSAGDYQADEQAGVARLRCRVSGRLVHRCRVAQLAIIKQMTGQVSCGSAGDYQADEQAGSSGSAGDYQADEQAGVAHLSWRLSSR